MWLALTLAVMRHYNCVVNIFRFLNYSGTVTITSWGAPESHQRALHIRLITSQNYNSHHAVYLGLITLSPASHSDTPYKPHSNIRPV